MIIATAGGFTSTVAIAEYSPLDPRKFRNPEVTAKGGPRAHVRLNALTTLWLKTGMQCNLTCADCYIESSPINDRLVYLSCEAVKRYLDEIAVTGLPTEEIGFTGGEPFMTPELMAMVELCLERGFRVLVLTNAMRPMMKGAESQLALGSRYCDRLTIRTSLDHHTEALHETERGKRSGQRAIEGLRWLYRHGFNVHVAGNRQPPWRHQPSRVYWPTSFDLASASSSMGGSGSGRPWR